MQPREISHMTARSCTLCQALIRLHGCVAVLVCLTLQVTPHAGPSLSPEAGFASTCNGRRTVSVSAMQSDGLR